MLVLAPATVDKCALEAVGQPEKKPGVGNNQPKLLGNIQKAGVKNKHIASWRKHPRRHDGALPPDQQGKGAFACMDKSIVPQVLAFARGPVQVVDQKTKNQLKQQRGKDDCKHFNQPDRQPGQIAQLFKRLFHEYSLGSSGCGSSGGSGLAAQSLERLAPGLQFRDLRLFFKAGQGAPVQGLQTGSRLVCKRAVLEQLAHRLRAAGKHRITARLKRGADAFAQCAGSSGAGHVQIVGYHQPLKADWRLSTSLIQNDEKPAGLSSTDG